MTDGLKDAHREAIMAVIAANDSVERAVLFGSRATGTNTVTSDVDIALFGDRLTLTHRARLTAALEEIPMAQTVDLLLYDSIQDRALREHIRNEGVEWYRRLNTSEAKPHLEDEDNGTTITLEGVHNRQWSTVQLGEVANLLTGFPFRSDKYVSDPEAPRLLRGANIAQGILRWDAAKRWPQEANEHLAPYWLRKGDVVIAMDRPWIEAGLKSSSVRETDLPSLLVQRVARLRGSDRLDTRFLSYVIGCHDFAQHILSVQTGTAVPHISAQQIKEFEFLLPHVHEQRAIAHILGTLDDKIELNRRMNETLEALVRALFKSWFVDFYPVRAKMEGRETGLPQDIADLFPDRLVDSEEGEVPEGWCTSTIADIALLNPESWGKRDAPDLIRYVDLANTKWGHIDDIKVYTWADAPSRGRRVLRQGDTIVGTVRPGNGSFALIDRDGLTGSTAFAVLRPTRATDREIVWCAATSRDAIERLAHLADGAAYPAVRPRAALDTVVVLPDTPVRLAFSSLSAPLVNRLQANQREAVTLAALRDTLLPQLIAGELRVQATEKSIGRVG